MKPLTPLILLLITAITLQAQSFDKTHSLGLSYSDGISAPIGKINEVEVTKVGYAFALDVFYNGRINRWLGLQAGIGYSNVGYVLEDPTRSGYLSEYDGILGYHRNIWPPYNQETNFWDPTLPANITHVAQQKRIGYLSLHLKPVFYLPAKKVDFYIYPGISMDITMHQTINATIVSEYYGTWEGSVKDNYSGASFSNRASLGFLGGVGLEKKIGDKVILQAELFNKTYEVVKFRQVDYQNWYINNTGVKVGVTYLIKKKQATEDQ